MTRSRTRQEDPLKGFRFEPEFIPNEGVVDVWRHLSDQVPDLEIRIRELREQGIEVFEDVERDGETTSPTGKTIYDFYNVSDKQRLNRLVEVFTRNLDESQKKWIEMSVIMGIESCIENVFQHADRDQEFLGVKRGLSTEKPYARALVAVQMWLYGHVDFYCLDNGKGFVDPKTLRRTLPAAFREGTTFGNGDMGMGLWATEGESHEFVVISTDRMYAKHTKEAPMRKVQQPPFKIRYVPGAFIAGRIYHPQELDRQEDRYRREHHLPARQEP